jgi:pimeloyl-ACP methyl ester carboxylesterase
MSPEPAAIAADGTHIPLYVSGAGEVLLLVHGWTLDHRSFAAQAPLADDYRLVSFDRRGCGVSTAAPDLGAETADIAAIVAALGADRVHLLGVSQGARVALRFAATHPGQLRSLILQGAAVDGYTPPMEDSSGIPLAEYAALARQGRLDELRARWLAHPLMRSESLGAAQQRALEDMVAGYHGRDLLRATPAATAIPDLTERLKTLDVPTLLISGERETAARRAHAQKLLDTLPRAREVVLADCGHLSNFSRPRAYNATVREFLRSLGA